MPRLRAGQQVKGASLRRPSFECRRLDGESGGTREGRHARIGFDSEDGACSGDEQSRGDASAATDVEYVARRIVGEVGDQLVWIGGTGTVVAINLGAERQRASPVVVQHLLSAVSAGEKNR
jgi:hypothetical protein